MAEQRCEPSYEELKPWYNEEAKETLGAVASLPMRN